MNQFCFIGEDRYQLLWKYHYIAALNFKVGYEKCLSLNLFPAILTDLLIRLLLQQTLVSYYVINYFTAFSNDTLKLRETWGNYLKQKEGLRYKQLNKDIFL